MRAISQRITSLEFQEGFPLLTRETPPRLTKQGIRYVSVYEQISLLWKLSNKKESKIKMPVACNVESHDVLAKLGA